ncbi:cytochrome c oxidase assembly factor Coa1 family protein [Dyella sp.]|uniref:cytochrome c oxidase assembly factor Coa1 family protein n=1 Tax=Dyella sp. TaxID=1869338 RepID=UPI00284D587C|nr:cytochrome c oxidase assembly factor Coa1 family protein [Dyella sp.]MDR3447554.1 cytochrome c oxidase assembly factor Coa1 family protein [Dyella sp.]
MENTSGGGAGAVVPPEVDRWNWGAFLLTWIWGIGNGTFIAFLVFVPLVNIPMFFVLGAKGSAWAWQNKRWNSVEDFRRTQRMWARWGIIIPVLFVLLFGGIFWSILSAMKGSDAYKLAVSELQRSEQVTEVLGTPITTGFPMGDIQVTGGDGKANLSFSAEGPKGKGEVYIEAVEAMGQWRVEHAVFEDAATKQRIELQP